MKQQVTQFRKQVAGCALAFLAAPLAYSAGTGELGILDTSGINPNTGVEWAINDNYRLTFISSGRVDPTDNSLGDLNLISSWNAHAQSFANNSDQNLGGVTWNIIGSTSGTDARENTSTNDTLETGHAIMLIDGLTTVANNYADLWDGQLQNTITFTEMQGVTIGDAEPPGFPYTGTQSDGTALGASEVLRDISGGGTIRQGQADSATGWVDRANDTVAAADNGPLSIYAMSETLTVVPEASSALLIGIASFALLRRRR